MGNQQSQEIRIRNKLDQPIEVEVITNKGMGDQRVVAFTLTPSAFRNLQIVWTTKEQRHWADVTVNGDTTSLEFPRHLKRMGIVWDRGDESKVAG